MFSFSEQFQNPAPVDMELDYYPNGEKIVKILQDTQNVNEFNEEKPNDYEGNKVLKFIYTFVGISFENILLAKNIKKYLFYLTDIIFKCFLELH